MLGDFFPEMGFVVIGTLIFSLIEGCFNITNTYCPSKALKGIQPSKKLKQIIDKTTDVLDKIKTKYYKSILDFTVKKSIYYYSNFYLFISNNNKCYECWLD